MRKCLIGSLLLLLLLFRIPLSAFAAEAAGVDIPVVIDGGGTAYMIPAVNSPLPTENTLRVDNGRTGHFHINFTETGEYHYTISSAPSRTERSVPSDESFRLTVTVMEKEDGALSAAAVINNNQTAEKSDLVRFRKIPEPPSLPPSETTTSGPPFETSPSEPPSGTTPSGPTSDTTPSGPTSDTTPSGPPSDTTPSGPPSGTFPSGPSEEPPATSPSSGTPKTGDESHLTRYLLLSVAASAGLFGLALLYTVNTNKLIREERL